MLLRYSSFYVVGEVKTKIKNKIYANLTKFEAYSKKLAAKTLIQENASDYSEPEPYINIKYSWEEDLSSQLEEP